MSSLFLDDSSTDWLLVTKISRQPIGPLEDRSNRLSQNIGN